MYNGKNYLAGDTFSAGDGCNSCSCDPALGVACTLVYCPPLADASSADGAPE